MGRRVPIDICDVDGCEYLAVVMVSLIILLLIFLFPTARVMKPYVCVVDVLEIEEWLRGNIVGD